MALGAMPCTGSAARAAPPVAPGSVTGERLAAFGLTEPVAVLTFPAGCGPPHGWTPGLGDQRLQVVHHQRRHLDHLAGDRARRHRRRAGAERATARSQRSSSRRRRGFTVADYSKVGWSSIGHQELAFDSCRVPAGDLRRARPRLRPVLQILDEGRVAIAALATGLAAGCVAECLRHVADREAFGHHLGISRRSSSSWGHRVAGPLGAVRLVRRCRAAVGREPPRSRRRSPSCRLDAAMDNAGTPPRSSAATGSRTVPGGPVLPRCQGWRSAKAPQRSSGSSSRGNSASTRSADRHRQAGADRAVRLHHED